MNKPAPKEPSMDEILSSIRQIIADDDASAVRKPPTPPAAPPRARMDITGNHIMKTLIRQLQHATLALVMALLDQLDTCRAQVARQHNRAVFEVPEILALPASQGHQPYLDWLTQETS